MSTRLIGGAGAVVLGVVASVVLASRPACSCRADAAAAAAIGSLRAITSAQQWYASACGGGGFAVDLADLAAPPAEGAVGFVSPDLDHNGVIKSGYALMVMADATTNEPARVASTATCASAKHQPAQSYFANAVPVGEPAGRPFFATDARGVIYRSPRPIANPIVPGPDVVELH